MNLPRALDHATVMEHITPAPVDMGEVNGVRLTYVDGNVFVTPKLGKQKPTKQKKTNRQVLEKQL